MTESAAAPSRRADSLRGRLPWGAPALSVVREDYVYRRRGNEEQLEAERVRLDAQWRAAVTAGYVPRPLNMGGRKRKRDGRAEDYAELRASGLTRVQAAERLGVSRRTTYRLDSWTEEELEALHDPSLTLRQVSQRTGRTLAGVRMKARSEGVVKQPPGPALEPVPGRPAWSQRGLDPDDTGEPEPPAPPRKCRRCRYLIGSRGHQVSCG